MGAGLRAELEARIGEEVHVSDWLAVTQARIDAFADATGDHQWIHCNPERAARESPFGATIAHGYLTLALYALLRGHVGAEGPVYPGVRNIVNYGLDRLRFPHPVRAGDRVRGRFVLLSVAERRGGLQVVERFTVEIEGEEKPACIADIIRVFQMDA